MFRYCVQLINLTVSCLCNYPEITPDIINNTLSRPVFFKFLPSNFQKSPKLDSPVGVGLQFNTTSCTCSPSAVVVVRYQARVRVRDMPCRMR